MAKLYSKNSFKISALCEPRKETVDFILNFSKSLQVIDCDKLKFEMILN